MWSSIIEYSTAHVFLTPSHVCCGTETGCVSREQPLVSLVPLWDGGRLVFGGEAEKIAVIINGG
jgi:hypothetical protein